MVFAGCNALAIWSKENIFGVEVFVFEGVVIFLKFGISLLVHLLQELASMHLIKLYTLFVVVIYNA